VGHRKLRQPIVAVALCGSLLAAPAFAGPSPADQLAQATFEDKMVALVSDFESGSLAMDGAVERCVENFAAESKGDVLRDMIAGFLDVERDQAFEAGCRAVLQVLEAEEFPADDLRELLVGKMSAKTKAILSGQLLRAVYFSHEAGA
jgi:hypothetical protein